MHSFPFNKDAGLRPASLIKRDWWKCFPVNFAKFLRIPMAAASGGFGKSKVFNSTPSIAVKGDRNRKYLTFLNSSSGTI